MSRTDPRPARPGFTKAVRQHVSWQDRPLPCAAQPDWFHDHPVGAWQTHAAKALCGACPVTKACLEHALGCEDGQFGVWGGTTETEREKLRQERVS